MFWAGEETMNSDSPSTLLFDSVALRYSASLWCVLLVGFAKWFLKKTGGVVRLDCPAGRNPLSNKADNLLCLSLIWLNFTCHTLFFSHFLFTYWLLDTLYSILSSTQLCKFAIWACKLFFFYSVFWPFWQMPVALLDYARVRVFFRVHFNQEPETRQRNARQTRLNSSITAPHNRGEKLWNILLSLSLLLPLSHSISSSHPPPPGLSPLLPLSISLPPFFPPSSLPLTWECVGAGSRYSRSPLVQSPALIG